jgi:hypothetical protein
LAIDTTNRRFASIICCLALMSPRSIRRASSTSCSAVNRFTRPIDRRYSRSESSEGSTVRSISTFFPVSGCGSRRRSAEASTLPPSDLAGRPSASTISIPWSSR